MKARLVVFFMIGSCCMQQSIMSEVDGSMNYDEKSAMIQTYIRLATSIAYKGYKFLTRDIEDYDLQLDVLDHPYKKMIYISTQAVEQLFDHANRHDNPLVQIQALILLCRMPIPEWYLKSYHKGLDELYALCFDEQGNFVDASGIHDIRLIFKEYCRKAPSTGRQVAEISDWWCKNKIPYPMFTKYYASTCNEHNENLLKMAQIENLEDFILLKYLSHKYESAATRKIYDYQVARFFMDCMHEVEDKK